jgi:hypothetical protein
VAAGIQRSGPIITSAALLIGIVLGAFAMGEVVFMKAMGLGLLLSVLVDATLVRMLLVPASLRLAGPPQLVGAETPDGLYRRFNLNESMSKPCIATRRRNEARVCPCPGPVRPGARRPARADLSLAGRSTVHAMGMQGIGQEGLWLRKTKLRRDMIDRGKAYSHLYDLNSREITIVDHSLRQASVYAMSALNQDADARFSSKDLKLDLTPTGRRHQLQNWNCAEHNLGMSPCRRKWRREGELRDGPAPSGWRRTPPNKGNRRVRQGRPGTGFLHGHSRLAKKSPGQAKGMSEVVRRLAPLGLLCAVDVETRYEGTGRMAELSRKMASRIAVTYEQIRHRCSLKDEVFEIPKG